MGSETLWRPHHLGDVGERDLSLAFALPPDDDGQGRRAAFVPYESTNGAVRQEEYRGGIHLTIG